MGGNMTLIHQGTLQVCYSDEYKLFFLILNDFHYSLSNEIAVLSSID